MNEQASNRPKAPPVPLAVIFYDPEAPPMKEMTVKLTETAIGFMASFSDFELTVFATEASLLVRKAFEAPPSPVPVCARCGSNEHLSEVCPIHPPMPEDDES